MINFYKVLYFLIFLSSKIWEIILYYLNLKHTLKKENKIPDIFKDIISKEDFERSKRYIKDRTKFLITEIVIKTIVIFIGLIYLFPIFEKISIDFRYSNLKIVKFFGGFSQTLLFFFLILTLLFLLDLPFDIYFTFNLEKRYGFSKIDLKTYIFDKIKIIIIGAILGFLVLFILFNLIFSTISNLWWLFVSIFIVLFSLLINIIYPSLILPLFYKFEKLKDENLRKKIEEITKRVNLKFENIYTINASSRSLHTNAFFSGLGKTKKIVLYDTLINNHTEDEILSIFSHELGHYKHGHIFKSFIISTFTIIILSYFFYFLMKTPLITSFNFCELCIDLPLLYSFIFLFSILEPLEIFTNSISRRFEFEADRFAVNLNNKESMINSLKKLVKINLSNINPHPLFSKFKYTHPPPVERIEKIMKI